MNLIPMSYTEMYENIHRLDLSPKCVAILPPIDPIRELLKRIKETPVEYPPALLKARREAFISQLDEKSLGTSRAPRQFIGLIDCLRKSN